MKNRPVTICSWILTVSVIAATAAILAYREYGTFDRTYDIGEIGEDLAIECIEVFIATDSWDSVGGPYSIIPDGQHAITVSNRLSVHHEIELLLDRLREAGRTDNIDLDKLCADYGVRPVVGRVGNQSRPIQPLSRHRRTSGAHGFQTTRFCWNLAIVRIQYRPLNVPDRPFPESFGPLLDSHLIGRASNRRPRLPSG